MRRGEEEFPCLFKLGKNALRFSASRPEEEGENGNPNKVDIRRLPPSLPSRPLIAACPKREFVPSLKRRWVAVAGRGADNRRDKCRR